MRTYPNIDTKAQMENFLTATINKELTPMGTLFENMAAVFYGQDTPEYEYAVKVFTESESTFIRKKEREAAEKGWDEGRNITPKDKGKNDGWEYVNCLSKEDYLNQNYPL